MVRGFHYRTNIFAALSSLEKHCHLGQGRSSHFLMPVALFVCPHCEKHAEVQVTSVTRSRPCPHCGELVVLQVAARDKTKRRALLVATGGAPAIVPADANAGNGPAYEPQLLEGDVLERMKLDPEVIAFRKRLIMGLSAVAAVVVITVLIHLLGGNKKPSAPNAPRVPVIASDAAKPEPKKLRNTVGLRVNDPTSPDDTAKKLNFAPVVEAPMAASNEVPAAADSGQGTAPQQVAIPATDPRVQAAAAMEVFLKATNLDGMLSVIADRPVIEPHVREYVQHHPIRPSDFESLTVSNGTGPKGERSITVNYADGSKRDAVVVVEGGRIVVDWPSFVAWSAMEWQQFIERKPNQPTLFRVFAQGDQRFDHGFADSQTLICLKLQNPANVAAAPIYAYAERTGTIGQSLEFLLRQSEGKLMKLTLNLKYPSDPLVNDQVWIENLIAPSWMVRSSKSTASLR